MGVGVGDGRGEQALVEQVHPDADTIIEELRLMATAVTIPQLEGREVMEEIAGGRIEAKLFLLRTGQT